MYLYRKRFLLSFKSCTDTKEINNTYIRKSINMRFIQYVIKVNIQRNIEIIRITKNVWAGRLLFLIARVLM